MKNLIVFILAVSGVLGEVTQLQCIDNYLKKLETKNKDDSIVCQNIVQNFTSGFEMEFFKFLDPVIDRSCAKEVFDKYRVSNVYLKGLSKKLQGFIDENQFKTSTFATMKDLAGLQGICMTDTQFKQFFKTIQNEIKTRKRSDHEKLCMERFFVEKKLINPKSFKIDARSKYVRNCGKIRKSLEETKLEGYEGLDLIFGIPSEEVWECVKQKSLNELWNARVESFNYVLTSSVITTDELEEIQGKYYNFVRSKSRAPFECIQKHL